MFEWWPWTKLNRARRLAQQMVWYRHALFVDFRTAKETGSTDMIVVTIGLAFDYHIPPSLLDIPIIVNEQIDYNKELMQHRPVRTQVTNKQRIGRSRSHSVPSDQYYADPWINDLTNPLNPLSPISPLNPMNYSSPTTPDSSDNDSNKHDTYHAHPTSQPPESRSSHYSSHADSSDCGSSGDSGGSDGGGSD